MTAFAFLLVLLSPASGKPVITAGTFSSIQLYQGNWRADSAKQAHPDIFSNRCYAFGTFFACQQTVNGKAGALIVFVSAGKPDHFHTQALLPNGNATGRGDLLIQGSRWTYSSQDTESGKTTRYRTTNQFQGTDRIHFEISHSADGKTWIADRQGDEQRLTVK